MTGVCGQLQNYIAVIHGGNPAGSLGPYRVTFLLSRDAAVADVGITMDPNAHGDSLVQLPAGPYATSGGSKFATLVVYATTPTGKTFELRGLPNDAGRLGKFECQPFEAAGFHEAAMHAKDALWGFLSSWSCLLDVPLWIRTTLVAEVSTGAMQVDWREPYPITPLAISPRAAFGPEFKAYAGLYREAIACQSDAHQLLCLFKITEALWKRRARIAEQARASGTQVPTKVDERFPSDPSTFRAALEKVFPVRIDWDDMAFDSFFPGNVRGKRFGWAKEQVEPLRDRIAHALTDDAELPRSDDDLLHTHEIHQWLPVLKYMARTMMRNDFPNDFSP